MGNSPLPLVLLHGYPLDRSIWFGVAAALGAAVHTIAPDLPGFGKSEPLRGEPSIDAYAEEVLSMLEREKITRAVIAGMSMGGYVALALAERAPEVVAGLVLVNSHCYADTDEARAGRQEMIKKIRAEGPRVAAQAIIPKMFAPSRTDDPDFQRFALEGAEAAGVAGLTWALEAMARRPDRSKVIANAKFPILIIDGAEDRIVPRDKARQMADLNPRSQIAVVKNVGHGAVMEAPDEVASILRTFSEFCAAGG